MSYTFVQGNQTHTSGPNGLITRIVIHATVSPCTLGGARGNAAYFQSAGAGGLAHFVVDPGEIVQCCAEDIACWHAPPNRGSIGVELCDPQTGDPSRWADSNHAPMMQLAAGLVRDLCARHQVPMVYVDRAGLLAGQRGITTHFEVSQAWHQSDHTDPGPGFPMGQFIALVNGSSAQEAEVTDAEIEKVAQRVVALLAGKVATHDDMKTLLRGTADGQHPANLEAIARKLGVIS
jgi:N-acetyl-anhydromuramyl-L-alanine amidase AmpD